MPAMSLPENPRRRMRYDDCAAFPDDGLLHEILGGEHFVGPAPTKKHLILASRLTPRLESFAAESLLGRVFAPPCLVRLTEFDVLQPDLCFVAASRLDLVNGRTLEGAPDLVVEILSEVWTARQRDLAMKHRLYERYGVREYWIADPVNRTLRIDRLVGGALRKGSEARFGEVLTSPLLPGFELPLVEIFPRGRIWGTF